MFYDFAGAMRNHRYDNTERSNTGQTFPDPLSLKYQTLILSSE